MTLQIRAVSSSFECHLDFHEALVYTITFRLISATHLWAKYCYDTTLCDGELEPREREEDSSEVKCRNKIKAQIVDYGSYPHQSVAKPATSAPRIFMKVNSQSGF